MQYPKVVVDNFCLSVNDDSDGLSGVSKWQYIIDFPDASSLPKGSKKGNIFSGSGNANLYTLAAICISIVGNGRLFVWKR